MLTVSARMVIVRLKMLIVSARDTSSNLLAGRLLYLA
jgi:hypothetical protein